jgi:cytochrome bd-type quinol oxidase subunit 1
MKNNILKEGAVALILVSLLIVILNPFKIWMPDMMHVAVLAAVFVVFSILAIFILRERAIDEREASLRMLAGHASFLAGGAVIILGILVQGFQGAVDSWLIVSLVAMVVVKIGTRIYGDITL